MLKRHISPFQHSLWICRDDNIKLYMCFLLGSSCAVNNYCDRRNTFMLVYTVCDQSRDFALINAHNVFSKTSYFTVTTETLIASARLER